MPVVADARQQRVVDEIYLALVRAGTWPTFVDLDRALHLDGEDDAEQVLHDMPAGLLYGVRPGPGWIPDGDEIALTLAGVAACPQAAEDTRLFLAVVRYAAELERELLPGDPPAVVSASSIARHVAFPAAGRADAIARLGKVLRVESWGWSQAGEGPAGWSFTINRHVRRLRDVSSASDYWSRGHLEVEAAIPDAPALEPPGDDSLSIFISYSHTDKLVAAALGDRLSALGARVWLDEGELRAGDSIIERIATAISDVHFVVAIISENSVQSAWCRKELSLALTGGLGREGVKLLPLRLGGVTMPPSLRDVLYREVDPNDPGAVAGVLLDDARSHRVDRDSIGAATRSGLSAGARVATQRRPALPADSWSDVRASGYGKEVVRQARSAGITPAEYARGGLRGRRDDHGPGAISEMGPVQLVEVVREGVGRPLNNGSPGSSLYAVPFRLSRVPTQRWARVFEQTWDRPPEFSTMHRPGVCSVRRDVVTLNSVTIAEVERYHLKTLKLCVARTNEIVGQEEREEAAERQRERQREAQHDATIDQTIARLDFE